MELVRAKPRRIFTAKIENELDFEFDKYIPEELECLKSFVSCVLLGRDSSGFCKLKLQEFVQECVCYGKSEFLKLELGSLLDKLVTQILLKVDHEPFETDKNNELSKIALEYYRPDEYHSFEHFYLISKFEICWCNIRSALSDVIKICDPLESNSGESQSGFALFDRAISNFVRDRIERRSLYDNLELGLLKLVEAYRSGEVLNFCKLNNIVELLTSIEVFESFEAKLLEHTKSFYSKAYREHVVNLGHADCFRKFDDLIKFEKKSCLLYLNEKSTDKVIELVRNELLLENFQDLIDSENLKDILKNDDLNTVLLINTLYKDTQYTQLLYSNLFTGFKDICNESIDVYVRENNYEEYDKFMKFLFEYQCKLDTFLKPIIKLNEYLNRMNQFWFNIFNNNDNIIEYVTLTLTKYCDELHLLYNLDSEMDVANDKLKFVLHLFQYLSNKSYFELCYRNLLSSRLLYDKYINQLHYKTIKLLSQECGNNYICKLNDVTNFYEQSNNMIEEFNLMTRGGKDSWINKNIKDFEVATTVVSKVADKDDEFGDVEVVDNIPQEIKNVTLIEGQFKDYFMNKYKKKSLGYLPHLGTAEISTQFQDNDIKLLLSIYQAYCILLFNSNQWVNLNTLQNVLQYDYKDGIVRKQLMVLCKRGLIKFSKNVDFLTCDKYDDFELDSAFFNTWSDVIDLRPSKFDLFDINTNYTITKCNFDDMLPYIESSIVRYLKQTLEASSITIFKLFSKNPLFTLSREQFNKIIDSLVSREFIQYNKSNQEFLQYIP